MGSNISISKIKRLFIGIISVLMIIYVIFQMFNMKSSKIQTEIVSYMTASKSFDADAYIVRNEDIIKYNENKSISYVVDEGETVAADEVVAELFDNDTDASIRKQILKLKKELNLLQSLEIDNKSFSTNPDILDNKILQCLKEFGMDLNDNKFDNEVNKNELLYLLNERQIIIGKIKDIDEKTSKIKEQIYNLESSYSKNILNVKSPKVGYFVSTIDGLENYIDYNNVLNIQTEDIKTVDLSKKNDNINGVAGKVISGLNWYIVFTLPADESVNLSKDEEVMVSIPFALTDKIPARVAAINQKDFNSEAAIILRCDYMNSDLCNVRHENITLDVDNYSGLAVSEKSLHIETKEREVTDEFGNKKNEQKDVYGVYALYGSKIKFKEVIPICTYSNFIICASNPDNDLLFTGETISLYDEIVVGGTNLYDGKIVK